jgi:DNA-binding CsgD family transcriptional regulator
VRALHTGHGLIDPQVTGRLISRFAALSPNPPTHELDLLTPREHEVLRHIARGLSNAEIADTLVIEPGTVKTHVARVLSKLGLRTRVPAVIYAYEHGLVDQMARPEKSFAGATRCVGVQRFRDGHRVGAAVRCGALSAGHPAQAPPTRSPRSGFTGRSTNRPDQREFNL